MIFTKARSYDEILGQLDKNDVITIISCSSCARTSGTGGEDPMRNLAIKLREDGFNVHDGYVINTVCTPKVFQAKIDRKVNTLISMACSAGTSNMIRIFSDYKVVETTNDVGLMTADNKEGTVKVEMPYESCKDTKGKKFEMFSGKSINNVQTNAEVIK
jgi:uncharacterized membrane protein